MQHTDFIGSIAMDPSSFSAEQTAGAIARIRGEAHLTQLVVAQKAGLDQSRVSRIEKGEVVSPGDVERVLDALADLGATGAADYKAYAARDWQYVEPPSFWNAERACLELAEETLEQIETFFGSDPPWPLRRQLERHRDSLLRASTFLTRQNHCIAFIGDLGVGKSTAICFLFDLLVQPSLADKQINRPILETGAGGTTICEVHVKRGPEFGISIVPMTESEQRQFIADFCAAKWILINSDQRENTESVGVSREIERAIRNMSGLSRRRETKDGKVTYHDPVTELARSCASEEEFRTQVLGLVGLSDRTCRELWYDSATRKHPMEWVMDTFKAVNNGRLRDAPLPRSIDLLIPNFGRDFGELEISVVDTKGVDDVAVREDLDIRLKDARSAVVFCSRFNDAPGTSTKLLLEHMRKTFSERVDTGKVSILALPRSGEARATKDDMGELALTDAEGYEFKRMQVSGELATDDLSGVPMMFFNVESDDPKAARADLFRQLMRMRKSVEEQLFDLCAAVQEIIENREQQAITAAIEEVAGRLNTFLEGNRRLGAREQLAYAEAISTIKTVRYAATLWASTRRNGEYSGLNVVHLVGVGAARDASQRSDSWFESLDAFLKSLKADSGLTLATKTIEQIAKGAAASKRAFIDTAQRAGVEVYKDPLAQAGVWAPCAAEWGQGPGFTRRVANRLEGWFATQNDLKDKLEEILNTLWEQTVILPLRRLAEEKAPEVKPTAANVVHFPGRKSA
jgi:transcriptional regulator with XRE-family HTH domain